METSLRRFGSCADPECELVCCPHAGGLASFFAPWSRFLPPWVRLFAVQYPGHGDRANEPFVNRMDPLVDALTSDIEGLATERLVLFGHSMGAAVAREVALRLEGSGRSVRQLIVSGRSATGSRASRFHRASDDELRMELARVGGKLGDRLENEVLWNVFLPSVRNDYELLETYRPSEGLLSVPITALVGDEDAEVSLPNLLEWESQTRGPFDHAVFSGGHFYLKRHWAELARIVTRSVRLDRGLEGPGVKLQRQ